MPCQWSNFLFQNIWQLFDMQRNSVSLYPYDKLRQAHYSFPILFSTACFRKFLICQSSELMDGLVCMSRYNKCHANDKISYFRIFGSFLTCKETVCPYVRTSNLDKYTTHSLSCFLQLVLESF